MIFFNIQIVQNCAEELELRVDSHTGADDMPANDFLSLYNNFMNDCNRAVREIAHRKCIESGNFPSTPEEQMEMINRITLAEVAEFLKWEVQC